jgi:predicted translin family RNA/ssDNA-binding protein
MKQFLVVFETRQAGAIGEFSRSAATVEMHQSSFSETEVCREAMRQLHAKGLETRFPVRVEEVTA